MQTQQLYIYLVKSSHISFVLEKQTDNVGVAI